MRPLQASRLVHTGQVIVDLVMQVDALPAPGGDVLAHHSAFEVGGAFNVMAAARRSGMHVVYAGGHGSGRFGEMARQALLQEGVGMASTPSNHMDTGLCVAIVDASAERTFVTHMGAESMISRSVLDQLAVSTSDIIYVSGYSLLLPEKGAVLVDWLEQLPTASCVAFDPGPLIHAIEPALLARTLATTSIWTSNRAEAERFGGGEDIASTFDAIFRRVAPEAIVIVRNGSDGCLVAVDGVGTAIHHVSGFAVKAVDSNGAGDAHAGVFLAELANTADPITAARRANAAAAIAVTRRGPATAPRGAEIDVFISR